MYTGALRIQVFLRKISVYVNRNCLFKDLSVLEGVCELKQAERSRSEEELGTEAETGTNR